MSGNVLHLECLICGERYDPADIEYVFVPVGQAGRGGGGNKLHLGGQGVGDDHAPEGRGFIVRDIDGVVIFMKAATSKNRSDPTIVNHLKSRGIKEV